MREGEKHRKLAHFKYSPFELQTNRGRPSSLRAQKNLLLATIHSTQLSFPKMKEKRRRPPMNMAIWWMLKGRRRRSRRRRRRNS
jgi:hypothetical protein